MVQITVDADCGNSPKQTFIKDFNIAFAEGNIDYLVEHVSDTVIWEMIGDKRIEGKAAFVAELEQMKDMSLAGFTLKSVSTHGKVGAADGVMTMPNGEQYAFCDVYEFTNARGKAISRIRSYIIRVDQ